MSISCFSGRSHFCVFADRLCGEGLRPNDPGGGAYRACPQRSPVPVPQRQTQATARKNSLNFWAETAPVRRECRFAAPAETAKIRAPESRSNSVRFLADRRYTECASYFEDLRW